MNGGKVYLIGAGPGSPDLITVRGIRAVKKADVIICDSLLGPDFLNGLGVSIKNKQVEWLKDDNGRKSQEQINELMLRAAAQDKTVARIKTGDPHVFGRGAEETDFLIGRGIACEVIPGLTVATAFSALADLALTERQKGKSFAVVTARCAGGRVNENFPKADSLIIFMGVSALDKVIAKLGHDGWSGETPAVMLERVGMPWEKHVEGSLDTIIELANEAQVNAPAILILGSAACREPDSKRRIILFTGLDPTNFRTMGNILHWPAIRVVKNESEYRRLPQIIEVLDAGSFCYAIFTSKTSVSLFFEGINELGGDSRMLSRTKVVACGGGTAERLKEYGITADFIPAGMGSEGIIKETDGSTACDVLLVQSATATEELAIRLAEKMGNIERLCLHSVEPNPELGRRLPSHDIVYFTCPSGVRAYWDKYGREAFNREVWCIGDVTAAQLRSRGIDAKVVSPYVS